MYTYLRLSRQEAGGRKITIIIIMTSISVELGLAAIISPFSHQRDTGKPRYS